jgi:hypothetical protein
MMWMAGGGVKGGIDYGATDELVFGITGYPVHVHNLQATILHLLGYVHTRLTYRLQGRDYRLTGARTSCSRSASLSSVPDGVLRCKVTKLRQLSSAS